MLTHARNLVGALVLGSAVALTPMAAPVLAAPAAAIAIQQAGSVKVTISHGPCIVCDLQTNPQVAAALATNVCGRQVQVGEVVQALQQSGQFTCEGTLPARDVLITPA